ncbi:MAG: C-GCAxxG-C-C family protein [Oscillospiraceae bacterium]|nr:C-GCAxxG-C-C family protein [Oscillospiraceae bacterium]
MNRTERIKLADDLFSQGFACSQSVFTAFSDLFGIDKNTALKISAGLGAGVGRLREVCGVVTGASMIFGMKYGATDGKDSASKANTYAHVREFASRLKEKEGSIICRELLKLNKPEKSAVPQARTVEYYETRPCRRLVSEAADIICDMLGIK